MIFVDFHRISQEFNRFSYYYSIAFLDFHRLEIAVGFLWVSICFLWIPLYFQRFPMIFWDFYRTSVGFQ